MGKDKADKNPRIWEKMARKRMKIMNMWASVE